jgi:molecular chaperone GrpE
MTEQTETPKAATPDLAAELEKVRSQLDAAEKTRDEYLELARAGRREFESYQQRAKREQETERRFAQMPLAGDLLPALDNLERAVAAAKQAGDAGTLTQGVSMVLTILGEVLRRHGVVRVEAEGQPFDANRHEAVMQQPSADVPAGTVLRVLEPGYTIHERVLRPARVIVSTNA